MMKGKRINFVMSQQNKLSAGEKRERQKDLIKMQLQSHIYM